MRVFVYVCYLEGIMNWERKGRKGKENGKKKKRIDTRKVPFFMSVFCVCMCIILNVNGFIFLSG